MTHPRLILLAFALVAAAARAETTQHEPVRGGGPLLAILDVDHDGVLSASELAAAPVVLAALDLNDDGVISPDELPGASAKSRAGRGLQGAITFNVLFALDANHDGNLQTLEIANAVSSLRQLDLNGDGRLTRDELRPVIVADASR